MFARIAFVSAALLAGCVTTPTTSVADAQPKTLAEWEECARQTEERIQREKDAEVARTGDRIWGMWGTQELQGQVAVACGSKPGNALTSEQRKILEDYCPYSSDISNMSVAEYSFFIEYREGSTVRKLADQECARIYAANAGKRAAEEKQRKARKQAAKAEARAKAVSVERAYQRSDNYVGVVIRTDRTREVKCALVGSDGDYLRVESATITAPVDEIVIRSGGVAWNSVSCWY